MINLSQRDLIVLSEFLAMRNETAVEFELPVFTKRAQRNPGIVFSAATKASRRRRNSATIACSASCGPVIAAMPARCEKLDVHDTEFTISLFTVSTIHSGITPYPMRHPVIA